MWRYEVSVKDYPQAREGVLLLWTRPLNVTLNCPNSNYQGRARGRSERKFGVPAGAQRAILAKFLDNFFYMIRWKFYIYM